MSTKRKIIETYGVYFITFTCHQWMPLFDLADSYQAVYKWFDYLRKKGHHLIGYVIMPNHLHILAAFQKGSKSVNTIIGNAKRFMAYEIIKGLQTNKEEGVLNELSRRVSERERLRGKLHEVFEPSFDWKDCRSQAFIQQKLDYMHANPCKGKWNLAVSPIEYEHSSAKFYATGETGICEVTHSGMLEDMDLTEALA